jgi:DNA polymerase III gamma/tau subunit
MAWHTEFRPQQFEEMFGNAAQVLQANIGKFKTYLFHGPRGCGKTTLARLLGTYEGIDPFAVVEINAGDERRLEDTRELIRHAYMSSMFSANGKKLYIIDEAHGLTKLAQDSLLKIFEEPPDHVRFALCTTEPKAVSTTIRSRACQIKVEPLQADQMKALLNEILIATGYDPNNYIDVVSMIVQSTNGIPRDSIVLLEQTVDLDPKVAASVIRAGVSDMDPTILDICRLVVFPKDKGIENQYKAVVAVLAKNPQEPETVRRSILAYLGKIAMDPKRQGAVDSVMKKINCFLEPVHETGNAGICYAIYLSLLA